MKRIITLALSLCTLVAVTGCSKVDMYPVVAEDVNTREIIFLPDITEWQSFQFPPLNLDNEALYVNRGDSYTKTKSIQDTWGNVKTYTYTATPVYTSEFQDDNIILMGLYGLNCPSCDKQAAYFSVWQDKLKAIKDEQEKKTGLDYSWLHFAPMVMFFNGEAYIGGHDPHKNVRDLQQDLRELPEQSWFQQMTSEGIGVYDNVIVYSCTGGACKVLTPHWKSHSPSGGTLLCVNKKSVEDSVVIIDRDESGKWNRAETKEELDALASAAYNKILHDCIGAHEIAFDATVVDFENDSTANVNI